MLTPTPAGSLGKLSIPGCKTLQDIDSSQHVYHVTSPHALTQASGYLKYVFGKDQQSVFFRARLSCIVPYLQALFAE